MSVCVCVTHVATLLVRTKHNCCCCCLRCCCCCCWHCCVVMSRLRRPEMASMSTSTPKFLADTRLHVCAWFPVSICVRVCVCVCCGVWGVTCACVVSSSTFMSLVSLGLCWSLAVASRARLQSFIIKIFCTRIFINCFVSHPPQHTHTQTHPAHTHMRGESDIFMKLIWCCHSSFLIFVAPFSAFTASSGPQKRKRKWKWNCNMRPASNYYCRHHKATPNGRPSKLERESAKATQNLTSAACSS